MTKALNSIGSIAKSTKGQQQALLAQARATRDVVQATLGQADATKEVVRASTKQARATLGIVEGTNALAAAAQQTAEATLKAANAAQQGAVESAAQAKALGKQLTIQEKALSVSYAPRLKVELIAGQSSEFSAKNGRVTLKLNLKIKNDGNAIARNYYTKSEMFTKDSDSKVKDYLCKSAEKEGDDSEDELEIGGSSEEEFSFNDSIDKISFKDEETKKTNSFAMIITCSYYTTDTSNDTFKAWALYIIAPIDAKGNLVSLSPNIGIIPPSRYKIVRATYRLESE